MSFEEESEGTETNTVFHRLYIGVCGEQRYFTGIFDLLWSREFISSAGLIILFYTLLISPNIVA